MNRTEEGQMKRAIYGFAVLFVVRAATYVSGANPKPAPEYQLEISVFLCDPGLKGPSPQGAVVVLRDTQGSPIFKGQTDAQGFIVIPIDYRSLDANYQLEARLDLGGGGYIGGILTPHLRSKHYNLLIPTPVNIDRIPVGPR